MWHEYDENGNNIRSHTTTYETLYEYDENNNLIKRIQRNIP